MPTFYLISTLVCVVNQLIGLRYPLAKTKKTTRNAEVNRLRFMGIKCIIYICEEKKLIIIRIDGCRKG